MGHESLPRQVALVSYGTRFLRQEIALKDWAQHAVFRGARLHFHRLEDNALLADDFTLWLGILADSGATRLSLHPLARFAVPMPPAMARGDYAIVVHYPERYDIWAIGGQTPAGRDDELDQYWCVATRAGALPVPETNWKELAAAIGRDLDISVPSSQAKSGPFYGPVSEQGQTRMPLLAKSPAVALANWILSSLDQKRGWYDNDMHHHNDSGSYARAGSQEELDRLFDWGERLDSWITEAQIRAANETRTTAESGNEPPLVRLHTPAMKAASIEAQSRRNQQLSAPPPEVEVDDRAGASASARPFPWIGAIALAAILLAVIIFGALKLIAGYPWVAALVVLPLALYLKYRK